jgi:hypothetical protein
MPSLFKPEAAPKGPGSRVLSCETKWHLQAAQNMARNHLSECCPQIHPGMKQRLRDLRCRRETASGGGWYWSEAGRAMDCMKRRWTETLPGCSPLSPNVTLHMRDPSVSCVCLRR